jgi:hypothetical protein
MTKEVLTVRDVDENVWRRFRAKTEEKGIKTGQALNEALGFWIEEKAKGKNQPDPRRFLKLAGIVHSGGRVRWSEELDEALYGKRQ